MSSDESDDSMMDETAQRIDAENPDDVFKFLLTTDNHLGFMEKDPERGPDSFVSFEECLQIARDEAVDFILLGGDLFHENKPSRDCLTKCQKLIREYCMGDKPIEFQIVSDEDVNFGHTGFPRANFNDPNLNVALPVFTIHGNHDDPTGQQNLCVMDTLAAAGLVNYFGKANTNCDQGIRIHPVLLVKGCTKLAIYGLGAIKDERLHNMFEKGLVDFVRPEEYQDDWFNIFVIHQNRSVHGKKNYIPESFLPDFIDLVVWGHEHECLIRPQYNEFQKFYVTQPGSSVITSLSESELAPKHVACLKIFKKGFKLDAVPLRTIRPFVMDSIVIGDTNLKETDKNLEVKIEQLLLKKVEKMIEKCAEMRYSCDKQPIKPLIRLKVDYTNFEPINEIRFAQKMVQKVANPKSILQFYKKSVKQEEATLDPEAAKVLRMHGGGEKLEYVKVQDLVMKYFKKADEKSKLMVLTDRGLGDAIQEYIEKDEKDSIMELVNFQVDKMQKYLRQVKWQNEIQLIDEIKHFQEMRVSNESDEETELKEMFEKTRSQKSKTQTQTQRKTGAKSATYMDDDDDEDDIASRQDDDDVDEDLIKPTPTTSTRGRGRGRGAAAATSTSTRGSTRGRGRGAGAGRGRGASKQTTLKFQEDSENEIDEVDDVPPPTTTTRSGRTSTKASTVIDNSYNQTLKPSNTTTRKKSRIEFMDDEDPDHNDSLENKQPSNKRSKSSKLVEISDDDDHDASKNTNTYSIFKSAASKRK